MDIITTQYTCLYCSTVHIIIYTSAMYVYTYDVIKQQCLCMYVHIQLHTHLARGHSGTIVALDMHRIGLKTLLI